MRVRVASAMLGFGLLLPLASCGGPARSSGTTPSSQSGLTEAQMPAADVARRATLRYHEHYWSCLRAPDACDPARSTVPGSEAFDRLSALADTMVSSGLYVGPENPGSIDIESVSLHDDHAVVTACWWVTAVLYLHSPVAGGAPIVQSTPPTSAREVYEVVDGGRSGWRIRRADRVGDLTENVNQCRARR